MKKFFKTICIVVLCISSSLFSYSCVETGNETKSQKNQNYSYENIQPPPEMPIFEIYTFDFGKWESEWEKENTYMITYSAWLSYNNHVGDSWGYGLTYDGDYFESGSYIECAGMLQVYVTAFATEYDEYNDYGSAYVSFDSLDVGEEQTKEVTVTVSENRGRYTGNTAQWIFEITVKRIS